MNAIALDAEEVFFASSPYFFGAEEHGYIDAIHKVSGARRRVANGGTNTLAVDAEWVYRDGARIHKKTGAVEPLEYGFAFALGRDSVFFTALDGVIFRQSKSGGAIEILAKDLRAPQGPSVYGEHFYFVQYAVDTIERIPVGGGAREVLASGPSEHFPRATVADCYDVFYSIGNYGDAVRRFSLVDRGIETVASPGGAIAIDQASLFVVGRRAIAVSRVNGTKTDLGPGRDVGPTGSPLTAVAVDDEAVYWSSSGGVMRARK